MRRRSRRDGELGQGAVPSVIYEELRHDSTAAAKNEWHIGHRLPREDNEMGTILIVILVLLLIGALPTWPYSRSWGYYPSGGVGLMVLILVILLLMGRF